MIAIIVTTLLSLASITPVQDGTPVTQSVLPIDQVVGRHLKHVKETKVEHNAAKETRRHDKAMEKQLRMMRKGKDRFSLHQGKIKHLKMKQYKTTRIISRNANHY